jgi:5-methylcytosine-specific restriction endonuclease McrA
VHRSLHMRMVEQGMPIRRASPRRRRSARARREREDAQVIATTSNPAGDAVVLVVCVAWFAWLCTPNGRAAYRAGVERRRVRRAARRRPRTRPRSERDSPAYRRFRQAVLVRDGHRCQACGASGVLLDVHHRLPWASYPEARYDPRHAVVLCRPCHRRTDSYGRRVKRSSIR